MMVEDVDGVENESSPKRPRLDFSDGFIDLSEIC